MKAKFLSLGFLGLLSLGARADRPSVHGMLLLNGGSRFYVSHLPMFHAPHDYQLIMKVTLGSGPLAATLPRHMQISKNFFTLEPESMDLAQVMSGEKSSFSATVYDGHFERGGKALGNLNVQVERILYAKKLQVSAERPAEDRYLIFGEKGDYFAAHLIDGEPNLDAIAKVSAPYTLSFIECHTRLCPDPTKSVVEDSKLPLIVVGNKSGDNHLAPEAGASLGAGLPTADVQSVIYLERDELSL